jgi:hypothetical protein
MKLNVSQRWFLAGLTILLAAGLTLVAQAQLTFNLDADVGVETSGTAVDSWTDQASSIELGAGAFGPLDFRPEYRAGELNGVHSFLRFDGIDDVLLTPGVIQGSTLLSDTASTVFVLQRAAGPAKPSSTISWVQPESELSVNQFNVQADYNGSIRFDQGDPASGGRIETPVSGVASGWYGNWHVLTLVRDGNDGTIRVDGIELATGTFSSSLDSSQSTYLNVGGDFSGDVNAFDGDLAVLRIYNTALDLTTIQGIETELAERLIPIPEASEYAMIFSIGCLAAAVAMRTRRRCC